MIHARILLTRRIRAYAILVAIEERNLDMPQGPQSMEHDAAPQQEAPTDHRVAADGRRRAGMARTAPILRGGWRGQGRARDGKQRGTTGLVVVIGREVRRWPTDV